MKSLFKKLFTKRENDYKGILGAIIGDMVGVPYEFIPWKSLDFDLFSHNSVFSDDTIMTVAVAEWLATGEDLADVMRKWGKAYPYAGYGGMFRCWLFPMNEKEKAPYNSFGNGSGMRVSPCGFFAKSLEEALSLAKASAEVSHNHPEGIKGAAAIAAAIFMAKQGDSKEAIKKYIEQTFEYDLSRTCNDIRPTYKFNEICQTSCPEAIIAFLDSHDYESAIRLAVSLGGDSDTLACMAGGIAAAFYGVPEWIVEEGRKRLSPDLLQMVNKFDDLCEKRATATIEESISAEVESVVATNSVVEPIALESKPICDMSNAVYDREFTPSFITTLKDNEIFVFGSNLSGFHYGGAAHTAHKCFGAVWGEGVGLFGFSYAIPTMLGSAQAIKPYVDDFIRFAAAHPEYRFLVTRIGCGIAGAKVNEIAPMFTKAIGVKNIILPRDFVAIIEQQ